MFFYTSFGMLGNGKIIPSKKNEKTRYEETIKMTF